MSNMSVGDSLLLHNIIQATESDQNLSMLPDDFKDAAIQIMFQEALDNKSHNLNNTDISNKRSRLDIENTMDFDMSEGAAGE